MIIINKLFDMSFDYNSIDYDKLTEQFKENGYVVIENLYTKEYCDDLITQTVEAFEKIKGISLLNSLVFNTL